MISPVKIWREQKEIRELLGLKGKITGYTIIRVPPSGFEPQAPYPVVLVKLENGRLYTGQLVDYQEKDLAIGQEVETVFRRIVSEDKESVIRYGIKLRPL